MKKPLTVAIFSLSILVSFPVLAQNYPSHLRSTHNPGERVVLEADEVIDRDFLAAGEIVELYGTVNGDVYVAGGMVVLKGTVNGDVIAAGGQVKISGEVTQDVRVFGGEIDILGTVGRNVTIGGGNVYIGETADVTGSLVAGAGNLEIDGPIGGNILVGSGNLVISNSVGGDVEVGTGTLRIAPTANVSGNFIYRSEEEASVSPSAQISGEISKLSPSKLAQKSMEDFKKDAKETKRAVNLAMLPVSFLSALIVGYLLQRLAPRYVLMGAESISKQPWKSLGLGFLVLFLVPVAFVVLLITVLGIPLAFILLFKYIVALYVAKIMVSFWAGQKILDSLGSKNRRGWALVTGLLVYSILSRIPVVGFAVKIVTVFVGLGAIVLAGSGLFTEAREKRLI